MRLAIASMCFGDFNKLAAITLPSITAYAARIGADFLMFGRKLHKHIHYEKFQIHDLYDYYDRVLWMDCDIIIHPQAPSIFETVPENQIAAFNELPNHEAAKKLIIRACAQLGLPVVEPPAYYNSGALLTSKQHRWLFAAPEQVIDSPYPEQDHLNLRIITSGATVYSLPWQWNCMEHYQKGEYWKHAYFIHYSNRPLQDRMDSSTADLAKLAISGHQLSFSRRSDMNHLQLLLKRLGACQDLIDWLADYNNLVSAWNACPRGDWLLELAEMLGANRELLLRADNAIFTSAADALTITETARHHADLVRDNIDNGTIMRLWQESK
jgi:hypothetical protein